MTTTRLSHSQLRVLRLVASGLTNPQIARQLFISVNTVKTHIKDISDRLGTTGRTQAVVEAMRTGQLS